MYDPFSFFFFIFSFPTVFLKSIIFFVATSSAGTSNQSIDSLISFIVMELDSIAIGSDTRGAIFRASQLIRQ